MDTKEIILENHRFRIAICDPSNIADLHFSTRYSYCGYIRSIFDKVRGKELLYSPKSVFDPFSGEGFPDEFEMPVGYDEAQNGGNFLKIGVGRQIKADQKIYTNRDKHKISRVAPIGIVKNGMSVVFTQADALGENSYYYKKEILLSGNALRISHSLKNRGDKVFETLWYSHAFLPVQGAEGKLRIEIPAALNLQTDERFIVREKGAVELFVSYGISECEQTQKGICYVWTGRDSVNIQTIYSGERTVYKALGDYPLGLLQVFVNGRVISFEPKLRIKLVPEEVYDWSTEYYFN